MPPSRSGRDTFAQRLDQLRDELRALSASSRDPSSPAPSGAVPDPAALTGLNGTPVTERHAATLPEPVVARRAGRRRPPRPPWRNPFRRRARKPPRAQQALPPVVYRVRSTPFAPARWPRGTPWTGVAVVLLMTPLVAQLAYRMLVATVTTTPLLGGRGTEADLVAAGGGMLGGALTAALGLVGLGVLRGRGAYQAAAALVLVGLGWVPWFIYTRAGGLVEVALPSLASAIAPPGWPRQGLLWAVLWGAVALTVAACVDWAVRTVLRMRARWG